MKTVDPQASSGASVESQPTKPPTLRLVIRAQIIPEKAPPARPVRQSLHRGALLILGVVAVLMLVWVGTRAFKPHSTSTSAANQQLQDTKRARPAPAISAEPPPTPAVSTAETASDQAKPVQPDVEDDADASLSPVNEIVPNVPRSARQTIRGTIKVSVRVIVGNEGRVLAATAVNAGPSRYFEQLAVEASKKWTFSPTAAETPRTTLVRFNFTRAGTTVRVTARP